MLILIILSAFVSALIGLFVGWASDGLMAGVVYIKIVMIVFMAVPTVSYLVGEGKTKSFHICVILFHLVQRLRELWDWEMVT